MPGRIERLMGPASNVSWTQDSVPPDERRQVVLVSAYDLDALEDELEDLTHEPPDQRAVCGNCGAKASGDPNSLGDVRGWRLGRGFTCAVCAGRAAQVELERVEDELERARDQVVENAHRIETLEGQVRLLTPAEGDDVADTILRWIEAGFPPWGCHHCRGAEYGPSGEPCPVCHGDSSSILPPPRAQAIRDYVVKGQEDAYRAGTGVLLGPEFHPMRPTRPVDEDTTEAADDEAEAAKAAAPPAAYGLTPEDMAHLRQTMGLPRIPRRPDVDAMLDSQWGLGAPGTRETAEYIVHLEETYERAVAKARSALEFYAGGCRHAVPDCNCTLAAKETLLMIAGMLFLAGRRRR